MPPPPTPRPGRPLDRTRDDRVEQCVAWMIRGLQRRQIVAQAKAAGWKCCTRQVDSVIARATKKLRELGQRQMEEQFAIATARMHTSYRQAMVIAEGADTDPRDKVSALRAANEAQRALTALHGLEAPKRQEVTGRDGQPIPVGVVVLPALDPNA